MQNSFERVNSDVESEEAASGRDALLNELSEYIITGSDAPLIKARQFAGRSCGLDDKQIAVFERLCEHLTDSTFSRVILALAYRAVCKHLQYRRYDAITSKILQVQVNSFLLDAEEFTILPDPLFVIIEFQCLLLLAEHAECLRMHAHRIQQPGGYNASFKRPYFKALRESILKLKTSAQKFLPNLELILLRDNDFEVFGYQPKPRSMRRRRIETRFQNEFLSSSRIDKISRLQFMIFEARNKLEVAEEAETRMEMISGIFSEDRETYGGLLTEILDLQRTVCSRFHHSGALRIYLRSAFKAIKFVERNVNGQSIVYKRMSFILNYQIGMALLASGRSAESVRFFKISLSRFNEACFQNVLISKYLSWHRYFIEAAIGQAKRDHATSVVRMRLCVKSLEEVGKLPMFQIPYLHKIKKGRLRMVWNSLIYFRRRRQIRRDRQSEDFDELAEWSRLIGNNIVSGKQRLEFTRLSMDKCLKVVETGTHAIDFPAGSQLHHCNLGEYLLPGFAASYRQLSQTDSSSIHNYKREDAEKFYWDVVNQSIDPRVLRTHGIHYSFIALQVCDYCQDSDAVIKLPTLIIFAIEQFEKQIPFLSYSMTFIVLEHLRRIAKSIKNTRQWGSDSIAKVIALLERIFLMLENHRQSTLDDDDRASMEKMLQDIYTDMARSFFAILEQSRGTASRKLIVKAIIVYLDRSQLRWLRSFLSEGLRSKIENLPIDDDIKQDFLVNEHALRMFLAAYNDQIVLGARMPDSETIIPAIKRGIKVNGVRRTNFSRQALMNDEYAERRIKFIESLYSIRLNFPDFEWQMLKEVYLHIDVIFLFEKNIPRLWIRIIDGAIILVVMFLKKLSCATLHREATLKIFDWCEEVIRNGECDKDLDEIIYSEHFKQVDKIVDTLCLKGSSSGGGIIRLFVDPSISVFPFHEWLLSKGDLKIIHSPSSSISAQNRQTPMSLDKVLMVCPHNNILPLAWLESDICWKSSQLVRDRYLLDVEVNNTRDLKKLFSNANIVHYIGHVQYYPEGDIEPYLFFLDGVRIDLKWIVANVQFSNGAVVILNACKSGSVLGRSLIESYDRSKNYVFGNEFTNERASFATAFLACGASAVIATTEEVEDLAAFLFGWKFSAVAERSEVLDVAKIFFKTLAWCKSIRRFSDVAEVVKDLALFSQDGNADRSIQLFEKRFHELATKGEFGSSRYWSQFVIYR